jgi:hypothetical protein
MLCGVMVAQSGSVWRAVTNVYSKTYGVESAVDLGPAAFSGLSTPVARAGEVQPYYAPSIKCRVTQNRRGVDHGSILLGWMVAFGVAGR